MYYKIRGDVLALRAEAGHAAWRDAMADFAEFGKRESAGIEGPYLEAVASLAAKDVGHYRQVCENLLDRFENTDDPDLANSVAWTCSLGGIPLRDPARVVKLIRRALDRAPRNTDYADTLVLVLYRAGEYAEALQAQNNLRASAKPPTPLIDLYQSYYRALILRQLGNADEAGRWLQRARHAHEFISIDQPPPGSSTMTSWSNRVELSLLGVEASRALAIPAAASRKP